MRRKNTTDALKKADALLAYTMECTRHFDRSFKALLGANMVDRAMNAWILVCEANPSDIEGKIEKLSKAKLEVQKLDGLFNAAYNARALMGNDRFANALLLCADALRDITRWKRYNMRLLRDKTETDKAVTVAL